jgi:hypothetical protein
MWKSETLEKRTAVEPDLRAGRASDHPIKAELGHAQLGRRVTIFFIPFLAGGWIQWSGIFPPS